MDSDLLLGAALKVARKASGLNIRALAEKSGVSIGTLSEVESGKTKFTGVTLEKVCDALQISVENFTKLAINIADKQNEIAQLDAEISLIALEFIHNNVPEEM